MTDAQIIARARVIALRENINTARRNHRSVKAMTRRLVLALAEAMG